MFSFKERGGMAANELMVYREQSMESGYVTAEVYLSPLPDTEPMRVQARIGSLVRDILPAEARAPMICVIDGVPVKREWWLQRPVCEGDRIQFYPIFLGGKGSRSVLAIIAMIAVATIANWAVGTMFTNTATWQAGLVRAGIMLLGNALISAILPPVSGSSVGEGDKASSVYNVDTAGNQARIFSPIPVQYGRMKYYPNYAAQPYAKYHTEIPDDFKGAITETPNYEWEAGVQIYRALFCLGQGEYEIEQELIADTPLSSFKDVLVHRVLKPGELPTYVDSCVISSDAVSGQSLDKGDWIGPFPLCGPERKAYKFNCDIVFPQGLCKLNDKGKAESASVTIEFQLRKIDNRGLPDGDWFGATTTYTASSLTPQRRTASWILFYEGFEGGRYECRVRRIGSKDPDDNKDMTSCQWTALFTYLNEPAPLCPTATHYELVMKASDQLSSLSQRKISIIATRKLSSWDNPTPTSEGARSPARALWDKWTNPVYGDGLPRERIDIDMLRHYDALCNEREDRFDYVFENRVSSQEADQLIAKTMRCVALQRQGVKTIVRDELCDMPLTLFNPTNTAEKSVSLEYIQITEETTDGVIAEYFSSVKWDWEEVECPGPGRTYSNTSYPKYNPSLPVMQNPARITMNGITNRKQAEREGLYYAYTNALRRQFITWTTELQGALVYYGAPVLLATTLYNMQQGGEIRDYDESDGTIELTNGVRQGKIVLMRPNGTLTEPIDFDIVDEERAKIRLRNVVDFQINYGDYKSERTKYVILEGDMIRRIVKITNVTPRGLGDSGAPMYELRGVVDVPEVHLVDNSLLYPDPPELPPWEEPYTPDEPIPQPDAQIYVKLANIPLDYLLTYEALYPNNGYPASIKFFSDGAVRTYYYDRRSATNPVEQGGIPGQEQPWNHWIEPNPPIQGIGSSYEIMFIGYWGRRYFYSADPDPTQEFLDNPERWYMQGHGLYYIKDLHTLDQLELSTASALRTAATDYKDWNAYDDVMNKTMCYTDWISLDTNPELKGFWDTKPYPYPGDSPFSWDTKEFYVAIRDKATRTVQDFKRYIMGVHRKPSH